MSDSKESLARLEAEHNTTKEKSVDNEEDDYDLPAHSSHLSRDINARVLTLLTLGSAIGTGHIIGTGTSLVRGGPASLFIAYCFVGSLLTIVIFSLGEMAAFLPMDKGFSGYVNKYFDKSFGFAAGYNYFLKYAIVLGANMTGFGLVIQYWRPDLNVGIWAAILYVSCIACNFLPVRYYGELEFVLTIAKLLTLVIIYIVCLVITCGGGPSGKTIGFQYWREEAFLPYLVQGNTGRFLGWWAAVISSLFGFIGVETAGIFFGEAANPKKTIPKASRQVLIRIGFFYIFGVFLLTLVANPKSPLLVKAGGTSANASPFVIAIKESGIRVLPSFINACLLIFIASSANTDIYICSRQLYGLAKDGEAPKIFLKLTKKRVPWVGCIAGCLLGLLSFMNTKEGAATAFGYITSTVSVFGVMNWIYILLAYYGYNRAIRAQNVPREDIPFRMWFQPYISYVALFLIVIITIFNGYSAFIITFKYKNFITCYVGILANVVLIVGHKLWYKTKFVNPSEVDLESEVL
ncbi:dicarboxylic amino acid permease [Scheffersomyces stipitis CBS 6054]|uniref:Dicarboxylic amino acid permease n=1 Tax=Scheffersomyces stipitis (strain ATCC 58785 / CBS 6054 / NBRC 10063 / NRRL Y-11545) TaxID=322104 RepID=A3GFL8_PICST|nr:dicarboxylic amino acid permease [Scheffersomyces stipitis CBS 6054]EAZ63776.1 dicarboxylic amino acid permease [Scheffersomyces stipitis CBS 6054]